MIPLFSQALHAQHKVEAVLDIVQSAPYGSNSNY